ncbi:uncharacterized protein LOC114932884 [Nylanderia fulva]|uniref:uncharacterized protein LOC114932884 n=1 Tax=Nylanderia fulva TaxID=613905 RepID=UPI0010FBB6E0|nr:uncharacterized protein LOC114932884 [Nylanderia fulva]
MLHQWDIALRRHDAPGEITRLAIKPVLKQWLERKFGNVDFHITQVLSGHGCFGHYLFRIKRRLSPGCQQCFNHDDTSEHTLVYCAEWLCERADLLNILDLNIDSLNLENIIKEVLTSEDKWIAFSGYVNTIMRGKEEEERRLQAALLSPTSDRSS